MIYFILEFQKMQRKESFGEKKLSFIDRIIYKMRCGKIINNLDFQNKIVADTGCGYNYMFLQSIKDKIKMWYAVDLSLKESDNDKIKTIISDLNEGMLLPDDSLDIVTSMAIIEHLSNPDQYIKECFRILKKWWFMIITTPSPLAKPVLEFMTYKLWLWSKEEIQDHKKYYDKRSLLTILSNNWFLLKNTKHKYFQFWMNNIVIVKK